MEFKTTAFVFMFALALALSGSVIAQDGHGKDDGHGHGTGDGHGEVSAELNAEMEAWMKLAGPGEHHEHLASLAGNWSASSRVWMEPGTEPLVTHGRAENELIMGGRFIQSKFTGEFMGQPFHGLAIDGYDNILGKHVGTWIDTMGTAVYNFVGTCSDDGKVKTMIAEYTDPKGERQKMKGVTTIISEDKHTYEGFNITPEGDVKSYEITYTRR